MKQDGIHGHHGPSNISGAPLLESDNKREYSSLNLEISCATDDNKYNPRKRNKKINIRINSPINSNRRWKNLLSNIRNGVIQTN
jgi:hypothetical protein